MSMNMNIFDEGDTYYFTAKKTINSLGTLKCQVEHKKIYKY